MSRRSVQCALLAAMIAKHRWGSPIAEETLLSFAAIESNEYPIGSEVFEELRSASYITNRGKRGLELDNSSFDNLADVLFYDCGWEPFEIRTRLHHYEGWDQHDWA